MNNRFIDSIQQLSFAFARYHYDLYLKEHHLTKIEGTAIKYIVDDIYTTDKKNDLARFIRHNMKKSYGAMYNTFLVENIMNNIFEDDAYTKQRICTEIELIQD